MPSKDRKARAKSAVYDELTPAEIRDALERRKAQAEEYGTWVATMDITVPFGAALAYTTGSPVPVSNVERWDYDSPTNYMGAVCVVRQDSAEGKALVNPDSTTARVAAVAEGLGALANVPQEVLDQVSTGADAPATTSPVGPTTGQER